MADAAPAPRRPVAALSARLSGVTVRYGATVAVADLSLDIRAGEVLGLVGANGAGKSTLMRVLCGATIPDAGTLELGAAPVDLSAYGPRAAHRAGVRIVFQELSLCPNLSVAENVFVERPNVPAPPLFWRAPYRRLAREAVAAVFPGAAIAPGRIVGDLPIGARQMVEIARAATAEGLTLLVLDEPTSALDAVRSRQLRDFARARAAAGLAVVFISHKLGEVLAVADRVVAMRSGRVALDAPAADLSAGDLVAAMGGGTRAAAARTAAERGEVLATLDHRLAEAPVSLHAGEIVGVAGLEGDGQKRLLEAVFFGRAGAARRGTAAYVSGDRAREGVFPLWSVADNIAIGPVARRRGLSRLPRPQGLEALARRIDLDPARLPSKILELSGGNQQKALAARALGTDADILLLEDPTRGVDIGTKGTFYEVARTAARSGKLVLWHSTEDAEFAQCDRVLVMGAGKVRSALPAAPSEDAVLAAVFAGRAGPAAHGRGWGRHAAELVLANAAILGLVAVAAALVALNPRIASVFGAELLLAPAVALTLIALAQMFVVGGSEIDLGAGAFAGLVNVVSATLLVSAPLLGVGALAGGLLGYAVLAALIRLRAIPAIVVTIGASFIWYGLGYSLQPSPGGAAPAWLSAAVDWSIPGVPTPLVLILAATAVAVLIHRSRAGTVLKGFGANALALERSGWSPLRYGVLRYVVAGVFAAAGGLAITAQNGASDINAGAGYTLLSVAAVVLGGCRLLGGVIAPVGVAAGAVTLSLIGALLGATGVSTDFNAALQGLILLLVLGFRAALERRP